MIIQLLIELIFLIKGPSRNWNVNSRLIIQLNHITKGLLAQVSGAIHARCLWKYNIRVLNMPMKLAVNEVLKIF